MKIHFYSISKSDKIRYLVDARIIDGSYVFDDKTFKNTTNYVKVNSNSHITWKRLGSVNSTMEFILNKTTKSRYSNESGLDFNLLIETTLIEVLDNKIKLVYKYYVDNSYVDEISIYLLLKD